jgi:hypothetical protein
VFCFGSDGSQQEGGDAEAARMAVGHGLNVKIVVDDNDVTIAGHPSEYMPGYHVGRTLEGHGLRVNTGDGENVGELYTRMAQAVNTPGPVALLNERKMAVGIEGLEGSPHGHDVISVELAVAYLEKRGQNRAVEYLKGLKKLNHAAVHRGSSDKLASNRNLFGQIVVEILGRMTPEDRKQVLVIGSDLEGSAARPHPRHSRDLRALGIMERANFSAAAGFGMEPPPGHRGHVLGLPRDVSPDQHSRLNQSNVPAHFRTRAWTTW